MDGDGPSDALDVLIVGRNPGWTEDQKGTPFVGEAGNMIRSIVERFVPSAKRVRYTNAVRCRTPRNATPSAAISTACRPYLLEELLATRPKVVLALGNIALEALTGKSGISGKRLAPEELRVPWQREYAKRGLRSPQVMATLHPDAILRDMGRIRDVEDDLRALDRLLSGVVRDGTVEWSETPLIVHPGTLYAYDIETNAREFHDPHFRVWMVGVSDGERTFVLDRPEPDFLQGAHTVGHNAIGFDDRAGFARESEDTMLLAYLLCPEDAGRGAFNLQKLCVKYLGVPPWKDDVTWEWAMYDDAVAADPSIKERAKLYNARDTQYTYELYQTIRPMLSPAKERLYERLLKPAARMLARMDSRGIPTSRARLDELDAHYQGIIAETDARLQSLAKAAGFSSTTKSGKAKPFLPMSTPQVGQILYECFEEPVRKQTDKGKPSTDEETLNAIKLDPSCPQALEFVDNLLAHRHARKFKPTYVDAIRATARERDGWLYSYSHTRITTTVSGRTSATDWPYQTLPRDPFERGVVEAPPGHKLIVTDLSQIELRTMAFLSRESNLLELYRTGGDAHDNMAARIAKLNGRDAWTKQDRSDGKPVSFGSLYGAEAFTLRAYALKQYGIRWTLAQTERLRDEGFFALYPGLPKYYARVRDEIATTLMVTSPLGRTRRLDNYASKDENQRLAALREGINTPNQGLANDIALIGTMLAEDAGVPVCMFIHDANVACVPDDRAEWAAETVQRCMTEETLRYLREEFDVEFDVPLIAQPTICQTWG
jgi:uracil-DNA glycosylase family 4